MKNWPSTRPRARRRRHIPPFHPVSVGSRSDGWTLARQADFIGNLAVTRSVLAAARAVSMSREGAYRLRRRDGAASFAAAWDAAVDRAEGSRGDGGDAKVTAALDAHRFEVGLVQVIVYGNRYYGFARKTDSRGLLQHLARLDRVCRDLEESG